MHGYSEGGDLCCGEEKDVENKWNKRSLSSGRYVRDKKLAVIDFDFGSFCLGEAIQQPGNEGRGHAAFCVGFDL